MPRLMEAKDTAHAAQEQHSDQDKVAESTVGYDQIAGLEMVQ